MSLYVKTLKNILKSGFIDIDDSVLVLAAGERDRDAFMTYNFANVTISNIDHHHDVGDYTPYRWVHLDAEHVDYDNESFDWVFIHAGLHHCASPHKALCEMFRVSRKGVVAFEARDSIFMKIAIMLLMVPRYELEPVVLSGGALGGYRNTNIPNYVYRWTEAEVEKTINSYAPQYQHGFMYFYGMRVPTQRLAMSSNLLKRMIAHSFEVIAPILESLFRKQCNEFGFLIQKNRTLQPWLLEHRGELRPDLSYMRNIFDVNKYRSLTRK